MRKAYSAYKGVEKSSSQGKWMARICRGGKRYLLGHYPDEVAAAKAYDSAALFFDGEAVSLNFPGPGLESRSPVELRRRAPSFAHSASGFRGVNLNSIGTKWRACFQIKGKLSFLGDYATKEEAAAAYDRKAREVLGEQALLNFPQAG